MGNWALQAAVESWFSHGNGDALLFDETILAAADEVYNSFDFPPPGRLSDLSRLTSRTSIYFSGADMVLPVAMASSFRRRSSSTARRETANWAWNAFSSAAPHSGLFARTSAPGTPLRHMSSGFRR
jgi:hypothetical protein